MRAVASKKKIKREGVVKHTFICSYQVGSSYIYQFIFAMKRILDITIVRKSRLFCVLLPPLVFCQLGKTSLDWSLRLNDTI